jgi:hypothetical protein
MANENPSRGEVRTADELLLKLEIRVPRKVLGPSRAWPTAEQLMANRIYDEALARFDARAWIN